MKVNILAKFKKSSENYNILSSKAKELGGIETDAMFTPTCHLQSWIFPSVNNAQKFIDFCKGLDFIQEVNAPRSLQESGQLR